MRYRIDHDYHIHSWLSTCSGDPEQSAENILAIAEKMGLERICVTDHFWDESVPNESNWYRVQNFPHICEILPLPKSDKTEFLFGAETETDKYRTLGVSKDIIEKLDFLIIPTTHLHSERNAYPEELASVEGRAKIWVSRLDGVLDADLPFHKIGIAHLACSLIAHKNKEYLKVLDLIPEEELHRLFEKAAGVGVGIELNMHDMMYSDEERDTVLRPFRIAKEEGCRFYLGSDAHHPNGFDGYFDIFERAIRDLDLTENDKFYISR